MNQNLTNHVTCPTCGTEISVAKSAVGRKKLNIPFKNISEALQACHSVELAAERLECSVGYIYQELGKRGLKPRDIISGNPGESHQPVTDKPEPGMVGPRAGT